jgi:CRISPR/Cas system-associated exonuclease Cas4 (RecB family)
MKKEYGDNYYIEKARCWMEKAGITDVKYAKQFIKSIIGLKDCTITMNNKSIEIDKEKITHAKDILYGLKFIK